MKENANGFLSLFFSRTQTGHSGIFTQFDCHNEFDERRMYSKNWHFIFSYANIQIKAMLEKIDQKF
jgi:hypothetical protein